MLVLTRYTGETVDLMMNGKTVSVTVIKISGGQAKLGFEAPLDVNIARREINEGFKESENE